MALAVLAARRRSLVQNIKLKIKCFKRFGHLRGLFYTVRIELNVCMTLKSALDIPVGFAMAY